MSEPQAISLKWYALRTFTGHEAKVKAYIEDEVKRRDMSDRVPEVVIPNETFLSRARQEDTST